MLEFITSVAILPALRSKGFKGINQVRVWAGHTCDPAQKSQQLPIAAGDELLVRICFASDCGAGGYTKLLAVCHPVLKFECWHTVELRDVVGDLHQAFAAGVPRNVYVINPDRLSELFKGRAYGTVVLGGLGAAGQYFRAAAEVLDGGQVLIDALAFLSAVHQICNRD